MPSLTNAPWYVSNRSLHHDHNVPTFSALVSFNYNKFYKNVLNHSNPLIANLALTILPENPPYRLKRRWPRNFNNNTNQFEFILEVVSMDAPFPQAIQSSVYPASVKTITYFIIFCKQIVNFSTFNKKKNNKNLIFKSTIL